MIAGGPAGLSVSLESELDVDVEASAWVVAPVSTVALSLDDVGGLTPVSVVIEDAVS